MNIPQSNMFNQNYFQYQQIQQNAYVKNTFQLNNSTQSKAYLSSNQLPFGFPQDLLCFANKKRRETDIENMTTQYSQEAEQNCKKYQFNKIGQIQNFNSSKQHIPSQLNAENNNHSALNLSTSTSSQSSSCSSSSQSSSSSSLQSQICSSSFLSQPNFSETTSQSLQNDEKSNCSSAFAIDSLVQKKKNSFGSSSSSSQQPLQQSQLNNLAQSHNLQETSKFKTEMCKNWIEFGKCNYGKKCQFAHGKNELVDKSLVNKRQYKSKLCNSFHTQKYCPYGNRCMFIHESRTVSEIRQSTHYQKILFNLCEQNNKIINFSQSYKESKQQTALEQQNFEFPNISDQQQPIKSTLNSSPTIRLPIFQSIVAQQQEFNISQPAFHESIINA